MIVIHHMRGMKSVEAGILSTFYGTSNVFRMFLFFPHLTLT